jgi:hypothetical protein
LNPERARKVARILESLSSVLPKNQHANPEDLKIVAIIPVRGTSKQVNGTTLLDYTIRAAKASRYIKDVVVATDTEETAELARSLGARAPFLRPKDLSAHYVDVADVFRYALERIETADGVPDLVVTLEETYPFRTPGMLDDMITRLVAEGLDTVVAARKESRGIWMQQDGEAVLLADGFMPRQFKHEHALVGLLGLGCVTHPMFLRAGSMLSGKVGIFEAGHPLNAIEVRDADTLGLAAQLAEIWWKQ